MQKNEQTHGDYHTTTNIISPQVQGHYRRGIQPLRSAMEQHAQPGKKTCRRRKTAIIHTGQNIGN